MIKMISDWTDRVLGRGEASITVPVLDGALKSNNLLESASVFASLDGPQDLATDGHSLFVANNKTVLRYELDISHTLSTNEPTIEHSFESPVSALACLGNGVLVVALNGQEVRIIGGSNDGMRWDHVAGVALHAVNSISVGATGRLLLTDGSSEHTFEHWKNDLMGMGRSGRVIELNPDDGTSQEIASGLAHAFGACEVADTVWISESWRHRVVSYNQLHGARAIIDALPGYPSRISPASPTNGGGYWLTCFTMRTQLVEFVLREPTYRKRMIEEIDPAYWIAPGLNSGSTFLEPMQGAQLKTMGIVKPWAPPHSYGLVIRLNNEGLVRYSLHSRFDGKHHGVVSAVECRGDLYVLAKGCGRILRLSVAEVERSLQS